MFLIVTRSFPPELGGMQSLMWGLSKELSKNFMIKVFADYIENHKTFDDQASFSIERVGGPKFLRKYRPKKVLSKSWIRAFYLRRVESIRLNFRKGF